MSNLNKYTIMDVSLFDACVGNYNLECQYAMAINTAWNGSLPQAIAGDVFIAAPLV